MTTSQLNSLPTWQQTQQFTGKRRLSHIGREATDGNNGRATFHFIFGWPPPRSWWDRLPPSAHRQLDRRSQALFDSIDVSKVQAVPGDGRCAKRDARKSRYVHVPRQKTEPS